MVTRGTSVLVTIAATLLVFLLVTSRVTAEDYEEKKVTIRQRSNESSEIYEKELKLRASKDPNAIKFYFYGNWDDEDERHEIQLNNYASVNASGYNSSRPLVILIHGVLSDSLTFPDVKVIKNEYLRGHYEVNVVMVDYGALTTSLLPGFLSSLSYMVVLQGYNNTEIVGSRIVEFMSFLMVNDFLSGPEEVHLIGFSIGAHMAGLAGRNMFYQTHKKIGRITGLDPSPQFKSQHMLVESDAAFVDVTLTSMGFLTKKKRFGDVQFYMNGGGPHQPNCPNFSPFVDPYCSHVNSVYYYAKTLRTCKPTLGCRCDSARRCKRKPPSCENSLVYGERVPKGSWGDYYVTMS